MSSTTRFGGRPIRKILHHVIHYGKRDAKRAQAPTKLIILNIPSPSTSLSTNHTLDSHTLAKQATQQTSICPTVAEEQGRAGVALSTNEVILVTTTHYVVHAQALPLSNFPTNSCQHV